MEQLPPHVATADEPIPALHGDRSEGPDVRLALPIADMLRNLDHFTADEDVVGYVERFREHLEAVGIDVSVTIERDGTQQLMVGGRCDGQMRHRSRWIHFLFDDLDRDEERRVLLTRQLLREGRFADNRPSDSHQTTRAIRDFLQHEGRILIDPYGELTEGCGIPHIIFEGVDHQGEACRRAHRAYFDIRRRWRSDQQIKRAVRMLGQRTDHGWDGAGGAVMSGDISETRSLSSDEYPVVRAIQERHSHPKGSTGADKPVI